MNKKFVSNTAWIVGGQVAKTIISLVISVLTARLLGPSNYGIIGYIVTFITLLTAVANLGLGNIIIKEFVNNKENSSSIIKTAILLQLISSFISYVIAVCLIYVLNIDNQLMLICAMLQCASLVFNSFESINYYYQSRLESKITTIITLVAYSIVQIYKVILLLTNSSVILFSFASTLECIVVALCLVVSIKCNHIGGGLFSKDIAKRLLKESAPFILIGVISTLYASIDKIMLNQIFDSTEPVGYYTVANSLSHSWVFIIMAFITSFTPLIYESKKTNEEQYKLRARQLYCLVFWLSFFFSICVDILSPFIIPWLYGGQYDQSIIPTIILTWNIPFAYLGIARGIQFVSENKQLYLIPLSFMTAILNIAMNLFLIPLWGVSGAAVATIVSELFVCIIGPLLFNRTRSIGINMIQGIFFQNINFKNMILNIKSNIFNKNKKQAKTINADAESTKTCIDSLMENTNDDIDK